MNGNLSFFKRFKKTIIAGLLFLILLLAFANWLGFQHIPMHMRDLYYAVTGLFRSSDPETETAAAAAASLSDTTVVAGPSILSPMDTVMWADQQKRGEYMPPGVADELEQIRKTDFSKLQVAKDTPTDQDVQEALLSRYREEMANLLRSHNAHIRVGKCFDAPLKKRSDGHKETARVTCMVSAFNDKNENLGNISLPLDIVYDFVQLDGEELWYVTDFSQTIPYDYQLNK